MTSPASSTASTARVAERRRLNVGGPAGLERRSPADRRGENNQLFVHFRVGQVGFLLGILQVQEVLVVQELTPVPLAPPLVAGLINLRGQIVPAVDLRVALGEPPAERTAAMNVVVRAEAGAFSIIADEIYDVFEASPSTLVPPPANLTGTLASLATEVCKRPGALLLVLNTSGVQSLIEEAIASP